MSSSESHRITQIRIAPAETTFGRVVGRNSKGESYGLHQREWLVQAMTDSGLVGVTNTRPAMNRGTLSKLCAVLRRLLGRNIFHTHRVSGARVVGVHPRWEAFRLANGFASYLLFHLMGRALSIPAHEPLGPLVRDRVEAYDSTLCFQDPVHPEEGAGAVAREAVDAVGNGWRALKLKLGRPGRWFEPASHRTTSMRRPLGCGA